MESAKTPLKDLKEDALKDYQEAAIKIGHFNNSITKAIRFYFDHKIKEESKDSFNVFSFLEFLFYGFGVFMIYTAIGFEYTTLILVYLILFKISK